MKSFASIVLSSKGFVILIIISIFGILEVTAQTGSTAGDSTSPTDSTQPASTVTDPPSSRTPKYPRCVTSCTDDNGQILPTGDYAYCDQCNAFVKCSNGYLYVFQCALGTVYYDRILGVCVSNSNVCVNDSLVATTPADMASTTRETTSSSSTTLLSTTNTAETTARVGSATTTSSVTTGVTDLTTGESTTMSATTPVTSIAITTGSTTIPTTSTVISAISTTIPATSTTIPTISTTIPTTSTTIPTTSTTIPTTSTTIPTKSTATATTTTSTTPTNVTRSVDAVNTTGYVPKAGGEAESFWFAVDLYNRNSKQKMRAGALKVNSATSEPLRSGPGLSDMWYRLFGVMLVQSLCPNTAENMRADYQKCPLIDSASGRSNQSVVAICDFKIQYSPQSTVANRAEMIYMMCYK